MNFFDKKVCTGCNCRMSMRVKALEKSSIEKGLYFFIDMKKIFYEGEKFNSINFLK